MKCSLLFEVILTWHLLACFFVSYVAVEAKRFMRCELSRKLLQDYSFNGSLLSSWICLIEHESNLDTSKVTDKSNGSRNYGLFQINSKEWCGRDREAGLCKKKCDDFIDDNIDDDVECAKLIFDRDGFKHWQGWKRSCRSFINLPNLKILCNTR